MKSHQSKCLLYVTLNIFLWVLLCTPVFADTLTITQCPNLPWEDVWSPSMSGDEFQFGGTDRHAVYWRLALPVLDARKYPNAYFELQGQFPKATYFSFHVNTKTSAFLDKLTDYEIVPEPGSDNPYRGKASFNKQNFYRIKIVNSPKPPHGRAENTIYLTTGEKKAEDHVIVMYRIYEPMEGKDGGAGLPQVLFGKEGTVTTVPSEICEAFKRKGAVPDFMFSLEKKLDARAERLERRVGRRTPLYRPPNPVEFIVGDNFLGMIHHAFPVLPDFVAKENPTGANMDTRYLAGFLDPSFEATVLRFKPPLVREQVRYWSVGVYQPFNGLMYAKAVASYRELQKDPDGYITLVFTAEKNKPFTLYDPISGRPPDGKYNWMPYGGSYPLVWFRYLVPSPDFQQALFYYKGNPYDAEAIRRHMKDYYPMTRYMSLKELNLHVEESTLWKLPGR